MDVSIFDGVSGTDHHAITEIDSAMAHPRRIIRSFEENQVTGLCFGFRNMLALLPQSVGSSAPNIIAVLVVDPANVAGTVKASFGGTTAPNVGSANVFLGFLIDGCKFTVSQASAGT